MSKAIITEGLLDDIADAIIAKGGASAALTPAEMASAIAQIPSGGGGVTISSTTFRMKNGRASGNITCVRVTYNNYSSGTSGLGCFSDGNTSAGSTSSNRNAALFDNSYIIIHTSYNPNSISYNGEPVAYTSAGSSAQWDVRITLPNGFDNSYPLVFA